MNKRRLPIGIQTFRKIRQENYYYVDKTTYIQRLLDEDALLAQKDSLTLPILYEGEG